eukprot:COSAG04_NODE_288_length_17855_cov_32.496621_5_plen_996_part_00
MINGMHGIMDTMAAIDVTFENSLLFRNYFEHTGGIRINNVWPLFFFMNNTNFMANAGFHATLSVDWWSPVTTSSPGESWMFISHCIFADSGDSPNWTPMGHIVRGNYITDTVPDIEMTVVIEHVVVRNVMSDIVNGMYFDAPGRAWNADIDTGRWLCKHRDFTIVNATGNPSPILGDWAKASIAYGWAILNLGGEYEYDHLVMETSGAPDRTESYGEGTGIFIDSRARISDSVFRRNRASRGGALYAMGTSEIQLIRCLFELNEAWLVGGAVLHDGTGILSIQGSTFARNQVWLPEWASTAAVTVRLFTGGGVGPISGYPIWRVSEGSISTLLSLSSPRSFCTQVDEGQVHGVPYADCEAAWQASANGVARGLAPSWPSAPASESCANVSYGNYETHSDTIVLSRGQHTLHVGVFTKCSGVPFVWQSGGWIEITEIVNPRFPLAEWVSVDDRATVRYPGCNTLQGCDGSGFGHVEGLEPCAYNEAIWTSYTFDVDIGFGAGVAVMNYNTILVSDSVFQDNSAGTGPDIHAVSTLVLDILNTTFTEHDAAVDFVGVDANTCLQQPCSSGQRCIYRSHSRFCEPCRDNERGDGLVCLPCEAGTEPSANQSICLTCQRPNEFSENGRCQLCEGILSPDRKFCHDCPSHQVPVPYVGGCQCEPGRYNVLDGAITCHRRDYEANAWERSPEYNVARELLVSARKGSADHACAPCPSCVDCSLENDPPRIRAGFSLTPAAIASKDLQTRGRDKTVFRCRPESTESYVTDQNVVSMLDAGRAIPDDLAQCLGTYLNNSMNCSEGHFGTLCGRCAVGWGRRHDNQCELCSEAVQPDAIFKLVGVIGGLAIVVGSAMIGLSYYVEGNVRDNSMWATWAAADSPKKRSGEVNFSNPLGPSDQDDPQTADPTAQEQVEKPQGASLSGSAAVFVTSKRLFITGVHTSLQPIKIMISYFQVATQLGNVLHFEFPEMLATLMRSFKWLVAGIQGMVGPLTRLFPLLLVQ